MGGQRNGPDPAMTVQRWDTTNDLVSWERNDEGDWVRYSDHLAELERVRKGPADGS